MDTDGEQTHARGSRGFESDFYGTKRVFSSNLAAQVADGATTDQEMAGSPIGHLSPNPMRRGPGVGRSAASIAEGEKNEQEGAEAQEAQARQEEAPAQQRDRSDDPEIMDNFEFMTKTVKKLQERIEQIDELVARTSGNLAEQQGRLKERIKKEQ